MRRRLSRPVLRRLALSLGASAAIFWTAGIAADTWKLAVDGSEHACLDPYRYFLLTMQDGAPAVGSIATFRTAGVPLYADGTLFTKLVAAGPGATVVAGPFSVIVDGKEYPFTDTAVTALRQAGADLQFEREDRYVLADDEYFLAGTNPLSYDSRYYGPVKASQFVARARPLW